MEPVVSAKRVRDESPFAVRGAAEGFYGAYFTFPERKDLIRFLGRHGFNFYLYGPKNDRQHRMRWWDPYPPSVIRQFGETIRVAQSAGVTFCYAISFGVPMNYASSEDFLTVVGKFEQFYDLGCRSFGLLLDDLADGFAHEVNRRNFPDVAHAHADCCNRFHEWAALRAEPCSFYLCPTDYHGGPPFSSYLQHLGETLHPDIQVFYTGLDICSHSIRVEEAAAFADALHRKPVIWDNYPVNDLLARSELHLGPLLGRDAHLAMATNGFVSNVMTQAEASKIPLATIARYLQDPESYDPQRAWKRALVRSAGNASLEPLRHFAENSLASCVQTEQAPRMTLLTIEAREALESAEETRLARALAALSEYCALLDESCYFLKNRMGNLELRDNLLPWIEALEAKFWLVRHSLKAVEALRVHQDCSPSIRSISDILNEIEHDPKSIGGTEVIRFATYVLDLIAQTEAATTPGPSGTTNPQPIPIHHGGNPASDGHGELSA